MISSMVGVGVLTTSGKMVATLGSNQLMLAVWVVGGFVALCGALSLAEIAAAWPRSGGDYAILHEAFGPLTAFFCGWVTLIAGFAAPIAASRAAFSLYFLAPWGLDPRHGPLIRQSLATIVVLAFTTIHASGKRRAIGAQGLVTLLELVALLAFIVAGLIAGGAHIDHLADRPSDWTSRLGPMAYSLVFVAYSYTGWNGSAYLAGEVRHPGQTLPWSILLGTVGVILLYVGLNLVYALALPSTVIQDLAHSAGEDAVVPIAELAARALFGDAIAVPLAWSVALILLATLSAYLLTGPRVMLAMARSGQLPAWIGRLRPGSQTPMRAGISLSAVALVLLWTGSFEQVVVYAGVGLTLTSMLAVASVYVLRVRHPDRPRPFRLPGYPVVPAVYLVGATALLVGVTREDPVATATSVASLLTGCPIYWQMRRQRLKASLKGTGQ